MKLDRRALFHGLTGAAALAAFRSDALARVLEATRAAADRKSSELAADEIYWAEIARAFETDRTLINLNNGGCSPPPPTCSTR